MPGFNYWINDKNPGILFRLLVWLITQLSWTDDKQSLDWCLYYRESYTFGFLWSIIVSFSFNFRFEDYTDAYNGLSSPASAFTKSARSSAVLIPSYMSKINYTMDFQYWDLIFRYCIVSSLQLESLIKRSSFGNKGRDFKITDRLKLEVNKSIWIKFGTD